MSAKFWIVLGMVTIAVVLPLHLAGAGVATDESLLALAHKARIASEPPCLGSNDERVAFKKFFQKTQEGKQADFTPELKAEAAFWSLINPLFGALKQDGNLDDKLLSDPAYWEFWRKDRSHPAYSEFWGKDRTVKAEWITWLCTNPKALAMVRSRGIDIAGARIEGEVNLEWVNLPFPLRAYRCAFTHDIKLNGAKLASLQLQSTHIKGLEGEGLTVDRDIIFTDGFRASGPVWLQNATINGSLKCDNGQFIAPPPTQPVTGHSDNPEPHPSLNLEGAKIGSVFMRAANTGTEEVYPPFTAEGEVRLREAVISGTVECDGGRFINPGRTALDLQGAQTGWVLLHGSFALGKVWLYRVTIDGNLECDHALFSNQSGEALNLDYAKTGTVILRDLCARGTVSLKHATIDGGFECIEKAVFYPPSPVMLPLKVSDIAIDAQEAFINGHVRVFDTAVNGEVSFSHAQIGQDLSLEKVKWGGKNDTRKVSLDLTSAKAKALLNEKESWPTEHALKLEGFTFDELRTDQDQADADTQNQWIERSLPSKIPAAGKKKPAFNPQPYEQMAAVMRRMGLQEEATEILIRKNEVTGSAVSRKDWLDGWNQFWNSRKDWLDGWNQFWNFCSKVVIGYGYRPWNAFYGSLGIILLGYLFFRVGYHCEGIIPTKQEAYPGGDLNKQFQPPLPKPYPNFNAFIYSLETFVPLLKLSMSDYWAPSSSLLRFYFRLHIILGWVLTTLWVGGLTGLVKT